MSVYSFVIISVVFVHLSDGVLISRGNGKAVKASSIHDLETIKNEGKVIIYFHDADLDKTTQNAIDSEQSLNDKKAQKANSEKAHFITMEIYHTEKPKFKEEFPEIGQFPALLAMKSGNETYMKQGEAVKIDECVKEALKTL